MKGGVKCLARVRAKFLIYAGTVDIPTDPIYWRWYNLVNRN